MVNSAYEESANYRLNSPVHSVQTRTEFTSPFCPNSDWIHQSILSKLGLNSPVHFVQIRTEFISPLCLNSDLIHQSILSKLGLNSSVHSVWTRTEFTSSFCLNSDWIHKSIEFIRPFSPKWRIFPTSINSPTRIKSPVELKWTFVKFTVLYHRITSIIAQLNTVFPLLLYSSRQS